MTQGVLRFTQEGLDGIISTEAADGGYSMGYKILTYRFYNVRVLTAQELACPIAKKR
jgi:hypothetical protein